MPHPAPRPRQRRVRGVALRLVALAGAALVALGPLALTSFAAEGLTMSARILLQGHARTGAWAAIEVDLQNDGPQIRGELRMDGGAQSNARYSMEVDLPDELQARRTSCTPSRRPSAATSRSSSSRTARCSTASTSPTSFTTRTSWSSACSPSGRRR